MAEVKLLVAGAVRPGGTLVVNGEDPAIAAELPRVMGRRPDLRVARFSTSDATAAASVRDGIVFLGGEPLLPVADIPLALRGHARHNIENALAAALAADACGVPRAAIAAGLRSLRPSVADSHGRTNLFAVRGADVLVDFAHNPDGLRRIAELARSWPASRRLLLLGQSGDRTDALIADFVREAVRIAPDRMLIKELPGHLRGRAPGEVPAILHRMLREEGVPEDRIAHVADEVEGAREALAWSKPGDLLLLFVHERPEDVYAVLAEAGAEPAT
jgi:UDP-N-acetylmuramyl tripeptide synthase